MNLERTLKDYLMMRRALGYKLEQAGKQLLDFVRYLHQAGSSFITTKDAVAWAQLPANATPTTWAARLGMVRVFSTYVCTLDPRTEIPSTEVFPSSHRTRQTPYVYSEADVQRLMDVAKDLQPPLRSSTYATLFGLLSVTGMRVGEAMALDRSDLDQRERMLTIRSSKFGKSREVVLHPTSEFALQMYARERDATFRSSRSPSFFVSSVGKRLLRQNVHKTFLQLIHRAGMADRKPRRPRIHDLRHSFAIRTLISWYRDGLNVEARLPRLSTYLGHVDPTATYWYLTAVPELLTLAASRLEEVQEEQR